MCVLIVVILGVIQCTADLERKVKSLYDTVCRLEEDKYDWEVKIRRQDFEVHNLATRGHCSLNLTLLYVLRLGLCLWQPARV